MADNNGRNNQNNGGRTYFDNSTQTSTPTSTIIPDLGNVLTDYKFFDDLVTKLMTDNQSEISTEVFAKIDELLLTECGYTDADLISNGASKSMPEKIKMLTLKMKLMSPAKKGEVNELLNGLGVNKKNIEKLMIEDIEKAFKDQDAIIKTNGEILEAFNKQLIEDKVKRDTLKAEQLGYEEQLKTMQIAVDQAQIAIDTLNAVDTSNMSPRESAQHFKSIDEANKSKTKLISDMGEVANKKAKTTQEFTDIDAKIIKNEADYKKTSKKSLAMMTKVEEKRKDIYAKFKEMGLSRPNIASTAKSDQEQQTEEGTQASGAAQSAKQEQAASAQEVKVNDEILNKPIKERAQDLAKRLGNMSQEELKLWTKGYGFESIEAALEYMGPRDRRRVSNALESELRVSGDTVEEFGTLISGAGLTALTPKVMTAIKKNDFSKLNIKDFDELTKFVCEYKDKMPQIDYKEMETLEKKVMDRISRAAIINKCKKEDGFVSRTSKFFKRIDPFQHDFQDREDSEQLFISTMTGYNKEKADRWRNEVELNNSVFSTLGYQYNGPAEVAEASETRNKAFAKKDAQRNSAIR